MASPVIINQDVLQTMKRSYTTAFKNGLIGRVGNTYQPFVTEVPMASKVVEIPMLLDLSGLREWVGDRVVDNFEARGFTMTAKKYEKTVAIDREHVEDDSYMLFSGRFEALGRKVQEFPDSLVWSLIEAGETGICYDDKAFFATDHPENETTAANLSGSGQPAWYLFDASQIEKPIILGTRTAPEFTAYEDPKDSSVFDSDMFKYGVRVRKGVQYGMWQCAYKSKATLDATAFDAAVTTMMQRKNDKGESLGINPTHLVVPASLRAAARNILNVEKLTGGADNPNFKTLEMVVCHRLSNVA
jgi:phage major head subunit gpT-like protein